MSVHTADSQFDYAEDRGSRILGKNWQFTARIRGVTFPKTVKFIV
jgi:hypothetical protein